LFLNKFDFYDDTEIIYYDYSKQALAFKSLLLEKWDGRNYPEFLKNIKKQYSINETFGGRTENREHSDLWREELEEWGGEEVLYNHWQRYKKLKHTFIHCDILVNPEKLINKVDNTEDSYIWWSNAFHTVTAHYTRNLEDLKDHYNNNWIKALSEKNSNLICYGTDILHNKLKNKNINECYFEGN
jgi:superfamily I DNA/RNA helicase